MRRYILIILLAITASGRMFAQQPLEVTPYVEKLTALLYHINKSYVDSVDTDKMVDEAIRGMLEELDPHSMYIPADEVKEMNEPLQGNFEGIGVQFNILKDTIIVVATISGGPSEKLGILAGDKIITIEDEKVAGVGIKNSDVVKRLRGPKDTRVKVAIARNNAEDLLDFVITRDKIPLYSLDAHYMAAPGVGYIKINRFSATTMDEFHGALSELQENGMNDLVLDLQGNGGGYLKTAIAMADEFLEPGKLIVYTEGKSYPRNNTYATETGSFEKGRLVVLIDEGSASASEIVSGAVQDWDRGLIIGRRSFGKGLVQRPIPLPDGSSVRLTIQKYYTPSGRCIQKPYDEGVEAYRKERLERYSSGEFFTLDSLKMPDSLKYFTQNNRIVYGGGGIMPDIFVPVDTSQTSDYFVDLSRKGVFNSFPLIYTNQHRKDLLKKYPTVEKFIEGFDVKTIINEFTSYAEEEGVPFVEEEYELSENLINGRLKGIIARNLWDTSAFYQVYNPYWPVYQKALQILENDEFSKFKLADYSE